ncbi:hypothetical protein, partial [Massilia aquatica]|uniref:hypothetical protein n=1 Tax=Massilia aquatica TaxID=2609000 RepID=UPI00351CBEF2
MRSLSLVCLLGLALGGCTAPPPSPSPSAGGIVRTQVHRAASSVPGLDAVVMRVELAAGARARRPPPPGAENREVLEGAGQRRVDRAPPPQRRARA